MEDPGFNHGNQVSDLTLDSLPSAQHMRYTSRWCLLIALGSQKGHKGIATFTVIKCLSPHDLIKGFPMSLVPTLPRLSVYNINPVRHLQVPYSPVVPLLGLTDNMESFMK